MVAAAELVDVTVADPVVVHFVVVFIVVDDSVVVDFVVVVHLDVVG